LVENRSVRQRSGLFVVEGPQGVREAVIHQPRIIREVYASTGALERYPEIEAAIADQGIALHLALPEVISSISSNAQELVAVAEIPHGSFSQWLANATSPSLIAILHNVRDPGNAGTVIRVADAFGADCVVLTGDSVEITNPKVVRSTAGSLFHIPVFAAPPLSSIIENCKAADMQVFAADGHGTIELPQLTTSAYGATAVAARKTAWLFGNEAWGLTEAERALADKVVRVPISGLAESLNLATAATVCLYTSSQSQQKAAPARAKN